MRSQIGLFLLFAASACGAHRQTRENVAPAPTPVVEQPVVKKQIVDEQVFEPGVRVIPYSAKGMIVQTAELRITDIELGRGEMITFLGAGDQTTWFFLTTMQGVTPHVIVKPFFKGLKTNLIIHTNKRIYTFDLVSGSTYDARVGVKVPVSVDRPREEIVSQKATKNTNWSITGNYPWSPRSVYDDGDQLYIEMPAIVKNHPLPLLYEIQGKKNILINYTYDQKINRFVVSRVPEQVVMFSGDSGKVYLQKK